MKYQVFYIHICIKRKEETLPNLYKFDYKSIPKY